MKKYLYQFMVALFAISAFTFVACSDDDDPTSPKDPTVSEGTYYCNLTFDGENLFSNKSFLLKVALWKYLQLMVLRISQYLFIPNFGNHILILQYRLTRIWVTFSKVA